MQNFMVNILSSLRGKLNLQFIVGFLAGYTNVWTVVQDMSESRPRSTLNQQWIWKCLIKCIIKHWSQTSVDPIHSKQSVNAGQHTHSFTSCRDDWKTVALHQKTYPKYLPLVTGKDKKSVKLLWPLQFLLQDLRFNFGQGAEARVEAAAVFHVGRVKDINWLTPRCLELEVLSMGVPEALQQDLDLPRKHGSFCSLIFLSIKKKAIEHFPMLWIQCLDFFSRVKHRNQTYILFLNLEIPKHLGRTCHWWMMQVMVQFLHHLGVLPGTLEMGEHGVGRLPRWRKIEHINEVSSLTFCRRMRWMPRVTP